MLGGAEAPPNLSAFFLSKLLLLIVKIVSECISDTLRSQNFPREHASGPLATLVTMLLVAAYADKIAPPNLKSCLRP